MRKLVYSSLLLVLAFCMAGQAAAVDDGTCRNGSFPSENADFATAAITGDGRAYLLYDMEGCPNQSVRCEKEARGYVLPGDRVITGRAKREYVCAYYPSRGGGSAGWVSKSRLRPYAVNAKPHLSSWTGGWSEDSNPKLKITIKAGTVHVVGEAYWPGPHPAKDWPSGWPHSGKIDGPLTLVGNRARYDDDTCKVSLTLIGDTLVVSDNAMCGGMNVRFDGVYRHVRG